MIKILILASLAQSYKNNSASIKQFSLDLLNWSKAALKIFIMLQKIWF